MSGTTSTAGGATIIRCAKCGKLNRARPVAVGTPRCAACQEPLPWLVAANAESFDAEARASVPVLVDLWAPWCGPCRLVAPVLEELARERAGELKVVKVNVDEEPQLARRFRASSIPTLVVLRGGQEVDRIVGAAPKAALLARLAPHPGGAPAA